MDPILTIMLSIAILIFFIIFFLANKFEKKRVSFLENLAFARGFRFDKDARILIRLGDIEIKKEIISNYDNFILPTTKKFSFFRDEKFLDYTNIQIFLSGHSKNARNLLIMPFKDNLVFLFDYSYYVGSGDSRTKKEYTVALIKLSIKLPDFYLRPENISDKIAAKFGFNDIDIEQYPEFSKKYYLLGKNKAEVLSFFTPERINYFEQNLNWTVYAKDNYMAFFKGVNLISIKDYEAYINEIPIFLSSINLL